MSSVSEWFTFAQKPIMFDKTDFLKRCNELTRNTLMETLEIEYVDAGEGFLQATMQVNPRIHQPMGLLHGGASAALAESVGSAASIMFVDPSREEVRGIELSANHLRSKTEGIVTGTARIVHRGRTLHLWEIRITDEEDRLISLCRLTNIILKKDGN